MSDNDFESAKIRKDVKKELKKHSERTGLSISDLIALGLPALDHKCSTCGKSFAEHAFLFNHSFKR